MGAAACLVNTAIASSEDPINMARAFKMAVEGGRLAYEAKMGKRIKVWKCFISTYWIFRLGDDLIEFL